VTNPIWLVKTRFQLMAAGQKQFKTYGEVIKTIYKEDGISGFFRGLSASYVGCTEGAIQWIVYENLKKSLESEQNDKKQKITPAQYARASSAAKFVAILMTYPHEVVRTRLREQGTRYKGFLNSLKLIAKEEGIRGLYGGVGLHLLRSVPNAAIMFVTFELVSNYLQDKIDNNLPLIPTTIMEPIKNVLLLDTYKSTKK
jgi:solute carrier family 25 protein 33/36